MRALVRSELIKLTTTKTVIGLVAGAAAVVSLGAFSTIMSGQAEGLNRSVHDQDFFMLASINLALFALVLGIRAFTDEFRHGSITPTLLITPKRSRVVVAKIITSGAASAVLAAVAQAVMLAVGALLLPLKGAEVLIGSTDVTAMAGLVLASALWGAIGASVGAMVRHQVAAIVGALIWVLLLENLGGGLLGDAGRFLPGQAAHALAQASQAATLLAPAVGALVLVVYALAAGAAATVRMACSDVTSS